MGDITIRDVEVADFGQILDLNAAVEMHTSRMNADRLRYLHELAAYHRVATVNGQVAGFLLALRDGAAYKNENFVWFSYRYEDFLYVDRIVVGATHSGLGIGSALYRNLFTAAKAQSVPVVACEYNIEPPNPASKVFHDKFGFREVGQQRVANDSKLVSLQIART